MAELKGTKTEKNLMEAFAGESMARNKYTYFASKAKKDGYQQIAAIFEETAANEKEHAKIWFKLLHPIGSTEENLKDAAAGENAAWGSVSPEEVVNAWMNSEGHRANILDPEARAMGVGYYYNSSSAWGHQWIQLFTK